jgi:hypothetical protein
MQNITNNYILSIVKFLHKDKRVVDVKAINTGSCHYKFTPCQGHKGVVIHYDDATHESFEIENSLLIGAVEAFYLPHRLSPDFKGEKHFLKYLNADLIQGLDQLRTKLGVRLYPITIWSWTNELGEVVDLSLEDSHYIETEYVLWLNGQRMGQRVMHCFGNGWSSCIDYDTMMTYCSSAKCFVRHEENGLTEDHLTFKISRRIADLSDTEMTVA